MFIQLLINNYYCYPILLSVPIRLIKCNYIFIHVVINCTHLISIINSTNKQFSHIIAVQFSAFSESRCPLCYFCVSHLYHQIRYVLVHRFIAGKKGFQPACTFQKSEEERVTRCEIWTTDKVVPNQKWR